MSILRGLAAALESSADELVDLAGAETHLPRGRLTSELGRTTFQLRWFADLVDDGACFDATIEHADPDFALGPRPDLRRVGEPIGHVLVFAASNFPFAFSVAGGDTAAALAAGCPVTVKAHPGHPRLSARVGELVASVGASVDVISGDEQARAALLDPNTKAAAFTGSTSAGRVLFDLAASRPDPIPFYGELGSINPAFASPGAVRARPEALVQGFVDSFTLGVGQFCTKPGLLFLPAGHGVEGALAEAVARVEAAPMLGDWVEQRYTETLVARSAVARVLHGGDGTAPSLLAVSMSELGKVREECFGPASIVVEYSSPDELIAAAGAIEGSLTATVHFEDDEHAWVRPLLDVLRARAGRVVSNGWPTGVAVNAAMHHGGPWPATTAPLYSSVSGNAIGRFLRPVCYQDVPDALLPPALQDANPLGIRRRVNGVFQ